MARFGSFLASLVVLVLVGCSSGSGSDDPPPPRLAYPETAAGSDSDTYFGHTVADPYRWLENIRNQDTERWVQAQNAFALDYISALPDYRAVAQRIAPWFGTVDGPLPQSTRDAVQRQRKETLRIEGEEGADGRLYYQRQVWKRQYHQRIPGTNPDFVSVDNKIYVSTDATASDKDEVLVDVNSFRVDPDDVIELLGHRVSPDSRYLAYLMRRNFSDLFELHVVSLSDPSHILLQIPHVFSSEFEFYNDGVIYAVPRDVIDAHVSPVTFQALYYQAFDGSEPELWLQGEEFDLIYGAFLHEGQLYINIGTDMLSAYWRLDPARPDLGAQPFLDVRAQQRSFSYLGQSPDDPAKMIFATTLDSAFHRVIEVDPANPAAANWREILPLAQGEPVYVNEVSICGSDFVAEHLVEGSSRLFHYSADGVHEIELPEIGAVSNMRCTVTGSQVVLDFIHSSLVQPAVQYVYDLGSHIVTTALVEHYKGYDPELYETKRIWVTSSAGARVPVYLAYKKGLQPTGDIPVLIYSYGGFLVPVTPRFDMRAIPLLEAGGIFAIAQLRGGAEFGVEWYDDGRLLNKQNTYNDLVAVAEHLIESGWTRAGKLALLGESNGGTTTAAASLQRPDLFGVAFPFVGVHDLVRYDKFTAGHSWHGDYGQVTDEVQFKNLMTFSPLHNVRSMAYPPMYVLTSKTDARVVPAHSYKFAATLQNTATGTNPYLLYAFPKDSHSFDQHQQAALTFLWTAFFYHMGVSYRDVKP